MDARSGRKRFAFDADHEASSEDALSESDLLAPSKEAAGGVSPIGVAAERERRLGAARASEAGTAGAATREQVGARLDEVVVHAAGAVRDTDLPAVPVGALLRGLLRSRPLRPLRRRPLALRCRRKLGRKGRPNNCERGKHTDARSKISHDTPPIQPNSPQPPSLNRAFKSMG